jgi:class 3 adenylate cyclase
MHRPDLRHRLLAILAADAVGYSRLMSLDELATVAALDAARAVFREQIAAHGGRVIDTAGDSVLAVFDSAAGAVTAALAVQRKLTDAATGVPEDRCMRFRIGVHLGDVIEKNDGTVYGDGVNIAARLEGLAEPGGIAISAAVLDQVRGKLDVGFEYLGAQAVKNIAAPVPTYKVRLEPEAAGRVIAAGKLSARRYRRPAAILAVVAVLAGVIAWLSPWSADVKSASGKSGAFPQIANPIRHFKVESPANLADADALTIYDRIRNEMAAAYQGSGDRHAGGYQTWRRYNATPYRSETHGRHYLNNYANDIALAYGKFEAAGTLPEGSVLAKDSFEVTERGDVVTGPLALMEKMAPGFNPESRDWRYSTIMPDGRLFGMTKGEGKERVAFCIECHAASGDEHDHLFFLPKKHRKRFLAPSADAK